jgi:putative drug exporter of the RND superfamily
VTTLGYTAAIVVVVAALAATTLLPAILGLIGLSINCLRLPGMRVHHDQRPHGWARWAAYVGSHPWPALIVGIVVLLVLAAPVRILHLGQTDNGALPKDTITPVLRHDDRRVRPRLERSYAHSREPQQGGP